MRKGEIEIEGVIGWEVVARNVKKELKDMGEVDEIDVYLSSPGGYIDDGMDTFTALKNHPAKINMHITSAAYSMGSVIAMAGDTISIEPTGMIMIHPPASIAWGTAVEMRKEATALDKYESRLVKAYKRRGEKLNLSESELDDAIAETTWYTAEEALDAGFVDAISDGIEDVASEPSNAAVEWLRVARYKNAPEAISKQIKTNRAKTQALANKLINNGGSAAETTGDEMSKYTQAELDAAVKAATEAATKEAKKELDADVKAAQDAIHERYQALMAHDNASNTRAVARLARRNTTIEEALEDMDDVAVAKEDDKPSSGFSAEEIERIESKAKAAAVSAARAALSDTAGLEVGAGEGTELSDDEMALKLAEEDNKRRGAA